MEQYQGLDYKLYKIYIWGGLALLVIYLVVAILVFEANNLPDAQMFFVLFLPVMLFVAGIFLYWWWVFLFRDNIEIRKTVKSASDEIPAISALKSWNTLHEAMAISGGSREEFVRQTKKARRPMLIWYAGSNLLAVWIFCPLSLGFFGLMENFSLGIWLGGVFVWIVGMLVATPILASMGGREGEKAYLSPLGLAVTHVPKIVPDTIALLGADLRLIPDGPAVVEGERYGRLVHIEMIDQHSLTVLQASLPEFQVRSEDGKLVPDEGAPQQVVEAIKTLRKAKRWQGIHIYGGAQGIAVQRDSKGTNMWLYDLWLAEYLLDHYNAG